MTETSNQGRPIGYARVSKEEQHLGLQLDALKKHGVIRIFTDKQTGTRFDRKAFLAALAYLNDGDTLVVWKLDRLSRSLKELIETVENLQKRNVALVSLTEHIDTTTATGTLFLYQIRLTNADVGTPQTPPGETSGPPFGHCSTGFDITIHGHARRV
jgi:DNA invertase Pin-like site-specific DNA recombinase